MSELPSSPIPSINVVVSALPDPSTDWYMIAATLAAAFSGSFTAAVLNELYHRQGIKKEQAASVNKLTQRLALNLETLLRLKVQFLDTQIAKDLSQIKDILLRIISPNNTSDQAIARSEWEQNITPILESNANLDGLLLKWDEIFLNEIDINEFYFLSEDNPNLIRILSIANEQMAGIEKSIKQRNELWLSKQSHFSSNQGLRANYEGMTILYEFIAVRDNIEEYNNLSLAACYEAVQQVKAYRSKKFPRKSKKWKWVELHLQDEAIKRIPQEQFKEYLAPTRPKSAATS